MKKILYSKPVTAFLKLILSIFYPKKYLDGYYFNEKRMGYFWALKGIPHRIATGIPWPVNKNTIVSHKENIEFHPDSLNVFQTPGCYFQNHDGKIIIGKNVHIAPNCGIITTNHNPKNLNEHLPGEDVVINDNCWIGMNSVILPGVVLGEGTVVAAGAVVTKSFEEGHCIVGGVPAKIIKRID